MLNEKGMLAAMKTAYRGNGYTVAISDGKIMLKGSAWGVYYDLKELPRKCLGLVAEHIGGLPDNTCCKLQKDAGAQNKLLDEELAFWEEKQQILAEPAQLHPIEPTMLDLGGFWIWQDLDTLQVWKVDRDYSRIIEREDLRAARFAPEVWPALLFGLPDMFAFVLPFDRVAEDAMMRHLDGFPWTGE